MATVTVVAVIFIMTSTVSVGASQMFDVVKYGAKPDGETDSTKAFLAAWEAACGSRNSATLQVPSGRFLVGKVAFRGPCTNNQIMVVSIDGTLVAPPDYRAAGDAAYWILFENVDGLRISGGILDGRGSSLWDCKASSQSCPIGARNVGFSGTKNVEISGLTSLNSQLLHIVVERSQNVRVSEVRVSAPADSPNTDGIHVESSSGVTIANSKIATGDDCVSIGPGTTNLWIENVACGPGHGISIGSLGQAEEEEGVRNVTVKSVSFRNTENGVRIKSWGRPSTGFARDILFQHALMTNVNNPILIDQNYCPHDKGCPGQASGVKISDVTYQDIHGSSATNVAVKLECSKEYPCSGIKLEDVRLTYQNQPAHASCDNAQGSASGFLLQPSSSSSCF